jgi:hypothetical protein
MIGSQFANSRFKSDLCSARWTVAVRGAASAGPGVLFSKIFIDIPRFIIRRTAVWAKSTKVEKDERPVGKRSGTGSFCDAP